MPHLFTPLAFANGVFLPVLTQMIAIINRVFPVKGSKIMHQSAKKDTQQKCK